MLCLAAVVQRITGLGFALVCAPPLVLMYGATDGVLVETVMGLMMSIVMLATMLRHVDWKRTGWLVLGGAVAAFPAAWVARVLPPAWLMVLIGVAALISLLGGRLAGAAGRPVDTRFGLGSGAAAGFLHVTSGLSGPPLVIYGLRSNWEQRSFVASLQAIFIVFNIFTLALRGFPNLPLDQLSIMAAVVLVGLIIGTFAVRVVPTRVARLAMLAIAWIGTISVLVRGVIALVS